MKHKIFIFFMSALNIKIINESGFDLPEYKTEHAAGMDLQAMLDDDQFILKPMERYLVGTGLKIELPEGYEAQIRPRSGLALRKGITVLNSPGTIDADYRGEIKVLLVNLSPQNVVIDKGDRIAQLVVAKHETIKWQPVENLSDTKRGEGGYGSTGGK